MTRTLLESLFLAYFLNLSAQSRGNSLGRYRTKITLVIWCTQLSSSATLNEKRIAAYWLKVWMSCVNCHNEIWSECLRIPGLEFRTWCYLPTIVEMDLNFFITWYITLQGSFKGIYCLYEKLKCTQYKLLNIAAIIQIKECDWWYARLPALIQLNNVFCRSRKPATRILVDLSIRLRPIKGLDSSLRLEESPKSKNKGGLYNRV